MALAPKSYDPDRLAQAAHMAENPARWGAFTPFVGHVPDPAERLRLGALNEKVQQEQLAAYVNRVQAEGVAPGPGSADVATVAPTTVGRVKASLGLAPKPAAEQEG